jgi:hypothetical protein
MPTNIRIIHAHDFLKATPEGTLDVESSKKLLVEIAADTSTSGDHEILLDTREAQSALSATDLWNLAAELINYRKALFRKTAVLCPLDRFDHAAFFALCAQNKGFKVHAFTAFEKAMEWLMAKEA